jgi:antitoxin VapB
MNTAKIFENGRSQAVRLPKEFRFDAKEVFVNKVGDTVVLIPKNSKWQNLKDACGKMPDDFMADRNQPLDFDKREKL